MRTSTALTVAVMLFAGAAACWFALADDDGPDDLRDGRGSSEDASGPSSSDTNSDTKTVETSRYREAEVGTAQPDQPQHPVSDDGLWITGRLVDATRRPAAGATVVAYRDGVVAGRVTADDDGGFRVGAGAPRHRRNTSFALHAWTEAGAVVVGTSFSRGLRVRHLHTVTLGPAHDVRASVTHEGAPLTNALVRGRFVGSATTDATGEATFRRIPEGERPFWCTVTGKGRADGVARIPMKGTLVLALDAGHDVQVTVVDAVDGRGIANARVVPRTSRQAGARSITATLGGLPAPTDRDGRTVVHNVREREAVYLDVTAAGYMPLAEESPVRVNPGTFEARVELKRVRRIRWPVIAGEVPAPPEGARITFKPMTGTGITAVPEHGRIEAGYLAVENFAREYFQALAVGPEGELARVRIDDSDIGPEISFRRPRKIEVTVHDDGGAPVAGYGVEARNQGNNPFGPAVLTDDEGRAVLTGFWGRLADVYVGPALSFPHGGIGVGSVNLDEGDGKLNVVIGRERTIVAEFTVDGKRKLPGAFYIGVSNAHRGELDENPETGDVRFTIRPHGSDKPLHLGVTSPGFPRFSTEVPPVQAGEEVRVAVSLETAGTVMVTVVAGAELRSHVELQRWWEDRNDWWIAPTSPGARRPSGGRHTFTALPPGRYRVRDRRTGIFTAPVDVAAGTTHELTLDVSRAGWAKGKVVVPEGASMADVRVIVSGDGIDRTTMFDDDPRRRGRAPHPDGSFQTQVPGDRPVTISVWHPVMRPAVDGGQVTLTDPRDGLVLSLESAPSAWLAPDPPLKGSWRSRALRVLLYRGEPEGKPAYQTVAIVADGALTFGGFTPGRWTLWLDIEGWAPLVLRDVELSAGETNLGTRKLDRGRTLRVTVLTKPGVSAPRMAVFASRRDEPRFSRGVNSSGNEVVVRGLVPGRYEVSMSPVMRTGAGHKTETIEIKGTEDAHLTFDAR